MSVVWIDRYADGTVGRAEFVVNKAPILIDAYFWRNSRQDGVKEIEICEEEEVVDNADTPLSI